MDSPNSLVRTGLSASRRHEAVASSKETTPPKHPPIFQLPVELLLSIIQLCDPQIKYRLRLTHTCQHWRSVISSAGFLWNCIHIELDYETDTRTFENFTSLLTIQLERAGTALLDVTWIMRPYNYITPYVVNFFRGKASFPRWRSLRLTTIGLTAYEIRVFHPEDALSSLESLELNGRPLKSIMGTLISTTTSKFNRLAITIHSCGTAWELDTRYGDLLRRVSELSLPAGCELGIAIPLPSNVVTLRVSFQAVHMFPHVREYTMNNCLFKNTHYIDLRALTHLVVNSSLRVDEGCHVLLPRLRNLKAHTIMMHSSATLEAPSLEHLHIWMSDHVGAAAIFLSSLNEAIQLQGFLLSPSKSITIDLPMAPENIIRLMENSPDVEEVTLTLGARDHVWEVMGRFGRTWVEATGESYLRRTRPMCPRLRTLKLNFEWNRHGDEYAIEDRLFLSWRLFSSWRGKASSITPEVYGSWKEYDTTYVQLL